MSVPVKIFIIWVLSILLVQYLGLSFLNPDKNLFFSLANWDGWHYIRISEDGYLYHFQYAFFPGYPAVLKIFTSIFNDPIFGGITLSLLSSFSIVVTFYKLVELEFSKSVAQKSLMFLLIFPTSFYFLAIYTESFFLALALLSFNFIKGKNFLYATSTIILASLTKVVGVVLVIVCLVWVFKQGMNRKNWFLILAPLPLLSYLLYLYLQTGDPLYFLSAQASWQRFLAYPGTSILDSLAKIASFEFSLKYYMSVFDLLSVIFAVGLTIRSWHFLPKQYFFYSFFTLMLPLTTNSLSSMPRFVLTLFPIFITLALIKNRLFLLSLSLVAVTLLVIFAILYINNLWVS